jgi:hypothetical protein
MNEHWVPFYSTCISLRFDWHITKLLPIIVYTLFQPFTFPSASLDMFLGIVEICFRNPILRSSMVHISKVYTLALRYPQRKQSQAERSGERVGHGNLPRSEITCSGNISHMTSLEPCGYEGLWLRILRLHNTHTCTVKRPSMELLWVFLCPIVNILFIGTARSLPHGFCRLCYRLRAALL